MGAQFGGSETMAKRPYQTARPGLWGKLGIVAKGMRHKPTAAESRLWQQVRGDKLGANFRRQHVIDRFVVDYVCLSAQLIVEVDGGIHRDPDQAAYDAERTQGLAALGYRLVRYPNEQVLGDMTTVLKDLRAKLAEKSGRRTPPFV
jgi:very-short-patch-repair endonuclease